MLIIIRYLQANHEVRQIKVLNLMEKIKLAKNMVVS